MTLQFDCRVVGSLSAEYIIHVAIEFPPAVQEWLPFLLVVSLTLNGFYCILISTGLPLYFDQQLELD